MASDNEASCVSDPNFAVICSFLEKFGSACGITSPDFMELQEMLENTQDVSPELIDLHVKLLRKVRRSVSGDRWERALIKLCHSYCSQDAWELERFGYKKARLSSKLQILKKLLEMQFDSNQKFKAEINRLTAAELRTEPIGRDKHGHAYWYQVDEHCQVRVYREDLDEETWLLVARDRDGLARLISQLASNDPNIGDLPLNEDSSSLSIEKPIIDTGQTSSATSNCEAEIDESSAGNEVDESSAGNEIDESSAGNEVDESFADIEDPKESGTDSVEQRTISKEEPILSVDENQLTKDEFSNNAAIRAFDVAKKSDPLVEVKDESMSHGITEESNALNELRGMDLSMVQSSSVIPSNKTVDLSHKRKKSINELAVNLRIKTQDELCTPAVQEQEIDLSMKKTKVNSQQFSPLPGVPYEPSFIERALRPTTEYQESDEEFDDEDEEFDDSDEIELPSHIKRPRLDRPTLLGNSRKQPNSELDDEYGDEIEEEVMYVRGEGSGRDCENENVLDNSTIVEVSDAIEESVFLVFGEGSGYDCDAANDGSDEENAPTDNKTEECKTSASGMDPGSSHRNTTLSEDGSDLNHKCDNVNRTESTSSSSEGNAISVSNKTSANSVESCTFSDSQCSEVDGSKVTVKSVCSAIKSDNNNDSINLPEVKCSLVNVNIPVDSTVSESSISPDQTLKLPKVGKIVVDVKSVERTPDANLSPVKKTSRWDVGKPGIDTTESQPDNYNSQQTNQIQHKEENILEVSTGINCNIPDKLDDGVSKQEIVNEENPKEEIPKTSCNRERVFEENESDIVVNSKESICVENIDESVKDDEKPSQLQTTQQSVSPQKQFFFGPGCFQFNSLITTDIKCSETNISDTVTVEQECSPSEDIQNKYNVSHQSDDQNETKSLTKINLDNTATNKADNVKIDVDQRVNINQNVVSNVSTSSSTTIEVASKPCTTETLHGESVTTHAEAKSTIKDNKQDNSAQNLPDESDIGATMNLDENSAGPKSTLSDVVINKTQDNVESTDMTNKGSSQMCIDNSIKNKSNIVNVSQTTTEKITHGEKTFNTEAVEDTVQKDICSTKEITLESSDIVTEVDSKEHDVHLKVKSISEQENNEKRDSDNLIEKFETSEVDEHAVKINKPSTEVEASVELTEINDDKQTTLGAYTTQPLLEISTSKHITSDSIEIVAADKDRTEIEADMSLTKCIGNIALKKSIEILNIPGEQALDIKRHTDSNNWNLPTETVQFKNDSEVEDKVVKNISENEEKTESRTQNEKLNENKTISLGNTISNEIFPSSETSNTPRTLTENIDTNKSHKMESCSVIEAVNDYNQTVLANSQVRTQNILSNKIEIGSSYTEADMDAEKRAVSEISDDTSSLHVETSSVEKDDVDQDSSNESLDISNYSAQEDNDILHIATDISETSMGLSENIQSQKSDDHENNSLKEIAYNKEQSFEGNTEILGKSTEKSKLDCDFDREKNDNTGTEVLDASQSLTEMIQASSTAKIVSRSVDISSALTVDTNIPKTDTVLQKHPITETSVKWGRLLSSDVPEADAPNKIVHTNENVPTNENIPTKNLNDIVLDQMSNKTTSVDDQESIKEDEKTLLSTTTRISVLKENEVNSTEDVSNSSDKDNTSILPNSRTSPKIEDMFIEQDSEKITTLKEAAIPAANSSSTSITNEQESTLKVNNTEEVPMVNPKNIETISESTEEYMPKVEENSILDSEENVLLLLNKCDKIKQIGPENKQLPKSVETRTDIKDLKSNWLNLKIGTEAKISSSNDDSSSTEHFKTQKEFPLSDNKSILTQTYVNPDNTNTQKINLNVNEEHLTSIDICANLSKNQKVVEKENVPSMLEHILDNENKNKDDVLSCEQSICKIDINKDNTQTEIRKEIENVNENIDSAMVVTNANINEIKTENKVLQSDSNSVQDAMQISTMENDSSTKIYIDEKTKIVSDTSKDINAEKNQVDVPKNLPDENKKKILSDTKFEESLVDEFSSDEDMFDSCTINADNDSEDDGVGGLISKLGEKQAVDDLFDKAIKENVMENIRTESSTAVDKKQNVNTDENKIHISIPEVTKSSDDLKDECKTDVSIENIPTDNSICKKDYVNMENKNAMKKEHNVDVLDLNNENVDNPSKLKTEVATDIPDDDNKPPLICIDITKLQDSTDTKSVNKTINELKIQSDISSPRSVESVGVDNEESSDIVDVPETDPLACTEEDILNEKHEESIQPAPPSLSLATFKLDGTEPDNSLIPEPIARALRNRKISMEAAAAKETRKRGRPSVEADEAESNNSVESKRRRMRGKRPVDMDLRRSVESKHADMSSSEEESSEKNAAEENSPTSETMGSTTPRRGTGKARRGKGRGKGRYAMAGRPPGSAGVQHSNLHSQTENVKLSPITKTPKSGRKKRRMMGLDIDPSILLEETVQAEDLETTGRGTVVRQSRRIAQLKIKEEAERRKIEELTLTEIKEEQKKKKAKKDDDKDYKTEKKKRKQKQDTDEDDESDDDVVESSSKKSRKKKRKHQDPRKIFNSTKPWQSSSDSSTSNEEEEEEEVEEEPSDEEAVLKSDHEFSPESDLESNTEVQPLRRARTVKKESDTDEPTDEHACQKCGKADHPEWILLCDKCDCGWHCSCLRPALLVIPEGDWFCPPCQHIALVEALKTQLTDYDKRVSRRDMEVRRQERLAYVGISLNNVLPTKEQDGSKQDDDGDEQEEGSEDESSNSESSSGSSSGDESEPIYQLRERRQAHSYRFNDYDELINSAIQDELEAVKGAGNQGRGKDIATIVNAEKEEAKSQALLGQQTEEFPKPLEQQEPKAPELETCPPVVPVYAEKPVEEQEELSERESEEELRVVPKMAGRKKHRKLNSLDISSEDDPDDDEDFKGTSEEEEDDLEDIASEDSDDFDVGRRGKRRSGPIRRSTRARTTRYDREFINDDSEDEEPRRKKTRSIWDESESEESDKSWGKRKKSKKQRQSAPPKVSKKTRKKKKRPDDSDPDVPKIRKPKKSKIKFGGLDDSDDDDEMLTRRTRGKKINYIDALGSDSDEDKAVAKRIESEEEYVANEEDEEEDVVDAVDDKESDSDSTSEKRATVQKKSINIKPARGGRGRGKGGIARTHKPVGTPLPPSFSAPPVVDDIAEDDDDGSTLDIPVIAANPDDLNEEEVGTMMMENEEYAKKQLELMAIQLAKEKKKKEREAKKREQPENVTQPPAEPRKRGRRKKVVEPELPVSQEQAPVIINPSPISMSSFSQNQIPSLSKTIMSPLNQGVAPLLMQPPNPSKLDGLIAPVEITSTVPTVVSELTASPPKRRGRGKGKKTLAAEAAAAAAATAGTTASLTPTSPSTGPVSSVPVLVPSPAAPIATNTAANLIGVGNATMPDGVPTVVTTVSPNEPPANLAVDASMHGGKLGIASPPQPFSQSQPAPSVITRMLQSQPVSSQTFTTVANTMNQKYFGGMCEQPPPPRGPPPGQFSLGGRGRVPSPYRQSSPAGMNLYPGIRPVAPNSPHRLRSPGPPGMQQMFHSTHHPMDPSPSGGGPINIAAANRDRNSPAIVPPTVSSPLTPKDGPTPPPPQYIRGPPMGPAGRFQANDASPGPSLPPPVRHHMSFPQPAAHMQQPSPPSRVPPHAGNFSPYHPPPPPNYHYGAYPPAPPLAAADDALPPTDYQASPYPEPQYTGDPIVHSSDGSNSKPFDEEGSGEFGGLVSYFSSQREDDLDT